MAKAEWSDEQMVRRVCPRGAPKMDFSEGVWWIMDDTGFPKEDATLAASLASTVASWTCGTAGRCAALAARRHGRYSWARGGPECRFHRLANDADPAQKRRTQLRCGRRPAQAMTHTLRTVSSVRHMPVYPGFMMKQSPAL
ncbi:MAG: hypothetical protein HY020_12815 [Burkholderiales bacterium]|nr:hypothetical protein [Burkholderiales bacterium]